MKKYLYAKLSWMKSSLVEDTFCHSTMFLTRSETNKAWKVSLLEEEICMHGRRSTFRAWSTRTHAVTLEKVIVRRTKFQSMTILISILFSPRYRYSKHFSSLNGRHNDISWGKKHFLSKKLKFITSLLSSLRRSLDKVEISLSFWYALKKEKRKRFM